MVEVQQQPFAAVEEAETEEVVVDEGCQWTQHDVAHAESDWARRHDHLRAQGRVAVHVLDIIGERRVGVMDDLDGILLLAGDRHPSTP